MIYFLEGKIVKKGNDFVVLKQNGLGLKIFTSERNLTKLKPSKKPVLFFCFLYFRQDHFELYGFLKEEELKLFEMLNSVSGVGPKTALTILEKEPVENIMAAIIEGQADFLKKISGISQKTAERIILELKNKIKLSAAFLSRDFNLNNQLEEILVGLGYQKKEVKKVLESLSFKNQSLEERLRACLKILGRSSL